MNRLRKLVGNAKYCIENDTLKIYLRLKTTGIYTHAFNANPASLNIIKTNGLNHADIQKLLTIPAYKEQKADL
jgi:hypothetical protein